MTTNNYQNCMETKDRVKEEVGLQDGKRPVPDHPDKFTIDNFVLTDVSESSAVFTAPNGGSFVIPIVPNLATHFDWEDGAPNTLNEGWAIRRLLPELKARAWPDTYNED